MSDCNLTEAETTYGLSIIIEGMRSQLKWSLGIFFALIIFGAGWMVNISEKISRSEEEAYRVLSVISKQIAAVEVGITALVLRTQALEVERSKGDRFTAADGKILEERIRSLEQLTDYYHPPKLLNHDREKVRKT